MTQYTSEAKQNSMSPMRVILVGAESCGKTTLTKQLAGHYRTWWVPEYWRYYWDAKHLASKAPLTSEEFIHIGKMQLLIERHYEKNAETAIFVDTDTFMTSVWHYRYLKKDSPALEKMWQRSRRDLILFCTPEIPFVQDGTRDGELIRDEMSQWIYDKLKNANLHFVTVSGTISERFALAKTHVDRLLLKRADQVLKSS